MEEINYEMIQQYLGGELTAAEVAAFELEMKTNAELAKEVALYKTIDEEMKRSKAGEKDEKELTSSLQSLTNEYFNTPKGKVIGIKKYWWYVATAAAAAVIAFILFRPASDEAFDNKKLYAHYTTNTEELATGIRGDKNDSLLKAASAYFNFGDFKMALPLLQLATASRPEDIQLQLAVGYCHMQTNSDDSAQLIFTKIETGNSVYKSKAHWYKALLFLKQNKIDECYSSLQLLPATADNYKDAQELMKKISKRKQ
jgi:Flp pilus assembly protein TadD